MPTKRRVQVVDTERQVRVAKYDIRQDRKTRQWVVTFPEVEPYVAGCFGRFLTWAGATTSVRHDFEHLLRNGRVALIVDNTTSWSGAPTLSTPNGVMSGGKITWEAGNA